jgi:hypothetical protein
LSASYLRCDSGFIDAVLFGFAYFESVEMSRFAGKVLKNGKIKSRPNRNFGRLLRMALFCLIPGHRFQNGFVLAEIVHAI